MANEIKATATLDDKLSPGLSKIESSIQKFSFSTDGMLSKLARSFSATDLAAGAVAGTIVALSQKTEQVYNKSLKAFVESNDAAQRTMKRFNDQINENDIHIGKAAFGIEKLRKQIELFESEGTSKGVTVLNAIATAAEKIAKYGLGGADSRGGKPGADDGPMSFRGPFLPGVTPENANDERTADMLRYAEFRRQSADAAEREAEAQTKIDRTSMEFRGQVARAGGFKPAGSDKNNTRWTYKEPGSTGFGGHPAGGAYDLAAEKQDKLAASMQKAQRYTDTLANGIQSAFSGMLFDGMRLSDGLKGIFRSLVDDILAELSAKAASAIVKAVLSLAAPVGPIGGGVVQVEGARIRSVSAAGFYERARGR